MLTHAWVNGRRYLVDLAGGRPTNPMRIPVSPSGWWYNVKPAPTTHAAASRLARESIEERISLLDLEPAPHEYFARLRPRQKRQQGASLGRIARLGNRERI